MFIILPVQLKGQNNYKSMNSVSVPYCTLQMATMEGEAICIMSIRPMLHLQHQYAIKKKKLCPINTCSHILYFFLGTMWIVA